jgi:hypothetical protein
VATMYGNHRPREDDVPKVDEGPAIKLKAIWI